MKIDNLPEWATYSKAEDIVLVDPDVVYPLYLDKLGYDRKLLTQAHLEVARLCFTEDLFQRTGKGLRLRILKKEDETWRLDNYLPGKPMNWAIEYQRIKAA